MVKHVCQGRQAYKALGSWPLISIREACGMAEELLKPLEVGEGRTARPIPPFRQVAETRAARSLPALAPRPAQRNSGRLDLIVLPATGGAPASDITRQDVLSHVLRPLEAAGHVGTVHRIRPLGNVIFRSAAAEGLMERDFTLGLRGALPSLVTGTWLR
jgi:hypothetical protein